MLVVFMVILVNAYEQAETTANDGEASAMNESHMQKRFFFNSADEYFFKYLKSQQKQKEREQLLLGLEKKLQIMKMMAQQRSSRKHEN